MPYPYTTASKCWGGELLENRVIFDAVKVVHTEFLLPLSRMYVAPRNRCDRVSNRHQKEMRMSSLRSYLTPTHVLFFCPRRASAAGVEEGLRGCCGKTRYVRRFSRFLLFLLGLVISEIPDSRQVGRCVCHATRAHADASIILRFHTSR